MTTKTKWIAALIYGFSLLTLTTMTAAAPAGEAATRAADSYEDITANVDAETAAKGKALYDGYCSTCHEAGLNRAPQRFILNLLTPENILLAMTDGVMKAQTQHIAMPDKIAVAEYLSSRKLGAAQEAKAVPTCTGEAAIFDISQPPQLPGWGFEPENRHFVPNHIAGITRDNVKKLRFKWALAYPTAVRARSQPTIAAGAIFVGSHNGTVYALDHDSGCARWTFAASAEVRTGILISPWQAGDKTADPLLFFGDLIGNQYAVKAFTGELVWKERMDPHPSLTLTGTATLVDNTLYVPTSSLEEGAAGDPNYPCCTFRGALVALDPASGDEKWRIHLIEEAKNTGKTTVGVDKFGPSGVPIWTSAAVDKKRGQLYLTTGDNYSSPANETSDSVVAVSLQTGEVRWVYQSTPDDAWNGSCEEVESPNCPEEDGPDYDFGAGPVLATGKDGKQYVVAGDKGGNAMGINPDTGKLVWKNKVGRGGVVAGIHFGVAANDGVAFIPVSDVPDGNEYDMPPRPGMYALDVATGEYIWQAPSEEGPCRGRQACYPGYSGAITATSDLVIAGANDGYLRIYDTKNGDVLWELDTSVEWQTVSDEIAHGGSMGGGTAPVPYQGTLVFNSGYGFAGKMPGNVLLVFEVAE